MRGKNSPDRETFVDCPLPPLAPFPSSGPVMMPIRSLRRTSPLVMLRGARLRRACLGKGRGRGDQAQGCCFRLWVFACACQRV